MIIIIIGVNVEKVSSTDDARSTPITTNNMHGNIRHFLYADTINVNHHLDRFVAFRWRSARVHYNIINIHLNKYVVGRHIFYCYINIIVA